VCRIVFLLISPKTLAFFLVAAISGAVSGQVRINEFVATSSDRLLQRSPGSHPQVGTLTPWQQAAYDDAQWDSGNGPFGFGSFSGVTLGTNTGMDMQNRVASLYLRKTFDATTSQAASAAALEFLVRYNDGFIAYLNGLEIARRNMGNTGMFGYHDQLAFNQGAGTVTETIDLRAANQRLQAGENTLSIQVHNAALGGAAADNLLMQATLRISGGATLVEPNSSWRYFYGIAEPSGGLLDFGLSKNFLLAQSPVLWATREFNDSGWPVGAGPVGIEGADPPHYLLGTNLYAQTYNITPSILAEEMEFPRRHGGSSGWLSVGSGERPGYRTGRRRDLPPQQLQTFRRWGISRFGRCRREHGRRNHPHFSTAGFISFLRQGC